MVNDGGKVRPYNTKRSGKKSDGCELSELKSMWHMSKTYGAENASFTPSKRPIWSEVVRLGAVAAVLGWPMGALGTKANPQTGDAAEAAARAQAAVVAAFFILF